MSQTRPLFLNVFLTYVFSEHVPRSKTCSKTCSKTKASLGGLGEHDTSPIYTLCLLGIARDVTARDSILLKAFFLGYTRLYYNFTAMQRATTSLILYWGNCNITNLFCHLTILSAFWPKYPFSFGHICNITKYFDMFPYFTEYLSTIFITNFYCII